MILSMDNSQRTVCMLSWMVFYIFRRTTLVLNINIGQLLFMSWSHTVYFFFHDPYFCGRLLGYCILL